MSEIQAGWEEVQLGDIAEFIMGQAPPGKECNTEGRGTIFVKAGEFSKEFPIVREWTTKPLKLARHGDVLICVVGATVGKLNLGIDCAIGRSVAAIRPKGGILAKFIRFQLQPVVLHIRAASVGSAQGVISKEDLNQIPILLPPLNEQQRIVTKLEKALSKVEVCQQRFTVIRRLLKRFRRSIIEAACSGKLTADWRGNADDEDDLPAGWKWVRVDDLLPKGGIFDGPFGSNLKTSDYTDSGVRVVRLENIGYLTFFDEKETFISKEKYSTLTRHTVGRGDIIFSSFIADEIRACVLSHFKSKAIAKADCFCLRPNDKLVDRTYLTFQLVSRESYNRLLEDVHGATRPRVNTTQLRKLHVRICPLPEQQEIVRCVEALFKTADALEARYLKAKKHVDKLGQSILSKAFKGELVPTEAELARQEGRDYEPASALLERIRRGDLRPQAAPKQTPKRPRGVGKKRDTASGRLF